MTDVNLEALLDAMLIGNSQKMQQLRMLIKFAGKCNSSIMITGPSGSGKEVVANAIHSISQRASGPNITVNCGALPEQLVESELFGHEKGSFTGAINQHVGLFEQSNSGTIFLDEIGDMPLNMQVKLLRVLETRIVNRVGGNQNIPIDVRVIAATHKNLGEAIQRKNFREDLFYRLCVVPIEVPALNERREDIPALVEHFLNNQIETNALPHFTAEAYAALQQYEWPGNVRELVNVIERAVVLCKGERITAADLPEKLFKEDEHRASVEAQLGGASLKKALSSPERQLIIQALESNGWNRQNTAKALGINRTTLYKKMKRLGLDDPRLQFAQ